MAAPAVPDQVHINQVRNALWRWPTGRASVMVGAGFSQNAKSKVVSAPPLPSWEQITRKIQEELYQTDAEPSVAPSATDGFLQLAQEYDATFGRTALCQLIKDTVRDEHFEPGALHHRLLSLPWRDVFTTNWDTLLERSRTYVTERSYGLVNTPADLASSRQPRIVKLHGSLPSHQLVFTDEDYRTYPNRFAPFVNTVQQAMMETVFLLIGFSGNDPNFRHWSGWVRDNMGTSAPMIYLAGWLNLSPHRRQVLESHNVVSIDLARHPQAQAWPERQRHRYAAEWVLHTLESGRPYDVIDWPTATRPALVSPPEYLEPVEPIVVDRPIAEPTVPSSDTSTSAETVRTLIRAWKHNRSIYPGWLTFPAKIRDHLSSSADDWEPHILSANPDFDAIERLHALEELIWRREMLLDPISDKLERAAADAMYKVDCQRRAAAGVDGSRVQWEDVRAAWLTMALALVTTARQRFDRERFDQRIEALSPFLDDHDDVHQRICHERALWSLYSIDFETLETALRDWSADTHDPVWTLRKASILVEIHRNDEARRLVRDALDAIRSTPWDGHDLSMPSREGWALFMATGLNYNIRELLDQSTLPFRLRRWRELATIGVDVEEEMRLYAAALQRRIQPSKPDFDLAVRVNRVNRFHWSHPARKNAAHRAVRLAEVAALPPVVNGMAGSSHILKSAADQLISSEPLLAMQIVLRVCTSDWDDVLKRVFSRTRVAALSKDTVDAIAQICFDCLDYSFRRVRDHLFWVDRFAVSMEVLSRIVMRFPPDHPAFERAVRYYSDFTIARNLRLSYPLRNLMNRCWEALPANSRSERVLDLMKSPIVGLDDVDRTIDRHRWVDAGETVSNDPPPLPSRDDKTEDDWKQVCAILIRGLRAGTGFRESASIRLALTGLCDRLTDIEKSQIATALWHPNDTESVGLPTGTLLPDHAFLWLPEPASGMAAKRFREKWLSEDLLERVNDGSAPRSIPIGSIRSMVPDPSFLDDVIGQVGIALSETKRIGHPFVLSDDECRLIVQYVDRWCDVGVPPPGGHFGDELFTKPIRYAVAGLGSIMKDVPFDTDIAAKLYNKLDRLHQSKIPAFGLIAGLTKMLPDRRNDLVMLMRKGLVSDDLRFSMDASAGLILWLRESTKSPTDLQPPSDDLLREIGMAIATRRNGLLHQALSIAEWIICNGQPSQMNEIRDLTVQGLGYLLEELRYDRLADTDTDEDVPLMRLGCARVAVALAKAGAQEPAVTGWIDAIDDDPLPEVRHAKRLES